MDITARFNHLRQLAPEQMLAEATRVLPPWIAGALVVALAWQLAQLTWLLIPRGAADALPSVATAFPGSSGTDKNLGEEQTDIRSIIAAHLMGEYRATPLKEKDSIDVTNIEATSLKLKLLGTLVSEISDESLAIIEDDQGTAGVYLVGEPIGRGASLLVVYPTQVVLNNSGKRELLELPSEYEDGTTNTRRTSARSSRRSATRRSATQSLTDSLAANPQKLTDLIRPQPVFANGKQIGYRVYPGRNRQQFVRLGLKPGDLVTEINGSGLDDPAKGLEIFRALEDESQVSVTVERNGQSQVLVLDTSVLNNLDDDSR